MNKHLKYVYQYRDIQYREKLSIETFSNKAFIEDFVVNFQLTYKKGSEAITYICRKDGMKNDQHIKGIEAYRILSHYYKVPKMDEKYCGKADMGGLSASPLLWFNEKYNKTKQYAYGYDMNSAYATAMIEDMPDTSVPMRSGYIVKGKEIGFKEMLNPKTNNMTTMLVPMYEGFSQYIFPLMESPFKKFVEVWFGEKSKKKGKEKTKAKNVLVYSVGYLQLTNPFLRATIIGKCNDWIESLIDEDTLFCNTDSIVSLKPLDLKIGKGLGEWKLEHKGYVAYKDYSYQWDDGKLSYRSIPRSWFPKDWDILKDDVPMFGNVYALIDGQLRRINDYEKF